MACRPHQIPILKGCSPRLYSLDMLQLRRCARQRRHIQQCVHVCSKIVLPCFRRQQSSIRTRVKSKNEVIFSGIQPTGVPHLGNYLGALRQWAKLQNDAPAHTELIYSIVDLHALTARPDPKQLRTWKRETLATMLAIGLDPRRSTIFYQSAV